MTARIWTLCCIILLAAAPVARADTFAVRQEIADAKAAIDRVFQNMPGMQGLGASPDKDLAPIQEIAAEAERNLRDAQRQAQKISNIHDEAWAVAYARAAKAMAETADELRRKMHY
jgi:hypothetical protein